LVESSNRKDHFGETSVWVGFVESTTFLSVKIISEKLQLGSGCSKNLVVSNCSIKTSLKVDHNVIIRTSFVALRHCTLLRDMNCRGGGLPRPECLYDLSCYCDQISRISKTCLATTIKKPTTKYCIQSGNSKKRGCD
jgi:hypothetical protein